MHRPTTIRCTTYYSIKRAVCGCLIFITPFDFSQFAHKHVSLSSCFIFDTSWGYSRMTLRYLSSVFARIYFLTHNIHSSPSSPPFVPESFAISLRTNAPGPKCERQHCSHPSAYPDIISALSLIPTHPFNTLVLSIDAIE